MAGLTIGIIPARGGSKGIPRKNIVSLSGRPLILYSIDQAKKAKSLDRVIVSTDDEEIARISRESGAEVIMRPKKLALDSSPALPVIKHVISELERKGVSVWATVYLQPTSPLRTAEDIDNAVALLKEGTFASVVSVRPLDINPFGIIQAHDGRLEFFLKERPKRHPRRQDLPQLYRFNGAIWATKREYSMCQEDHVFDPENTGVYVMPQERSVDIDDISDLREAEFLLDKS